MSGVSRGSAERSTTSAVSPVRLQDHPGQIVWFGDFESGIAGEITAEEARSAKQKTSGSGLWRSDLTNVAKTAPLLV